MILKAAFWILRVVWLLVMAAYALVFIAQTLEVRAAPELVGRAIAFVLILLTWKAGEILLCWAYDRITRTGPPVTFWQLLGGLARRKVLLGFLIGVGLLIAWGSLGTKWGHGDRLSRAHSESSRQVGRGFKPYLDVDGDSGIVAYAIGDGWIHVRFESGATYAYEAEKLGRRHIATMQRLAMEGDGLNSYIRRNRDVYNGYSRKW